MGTTNKWVQRVASKTLIGELILRLKPAIKKELLLMAMVFLGGYIGYRIDSATLVLAEYGRAITIGYMCLLGYAIRYMQVEFIAKLWSDED